MYYERRGMMNILLLIVVLIFNIVWFVLGVYAGKAIQGLADQIEEE